MFSQQELYQISYNFSPSGIFMGGVVHVVFQMKMKDRQKRLTKNPPLHFIRITTLHSLCNPVYNNDQKDPTKVCLIILGIKTNKRYIHLEKEMTVKKRSYYL